MPFKLPPPLPKPNCMNLKEFIIYLGQNPYKVIEAKENADALMQELGLLAQ